MNINDLTIGQAKELACLFGQAQTATQECEMVGVYAIIRTYSAGVWFGKVLKKSGAEIILGEARRLYYWTTANKGISLSEVSIHGLSTDSKVCEAVDRIWLQPIEIIPTTQKAEENIKGQKNYVA